MFKLEDIEKQLPTAQPRKPGAPTALGGIRVVDFSHFIAGPYATMMLADFGADVIKIEAPAKGDDFRHYPPTDPALPAQGASFFFANRNKRSVALDLKNPAALALVRELIAESDVLVENFSTGVMQRFGLDPETCLALNPRLVYCSVPAYSRDGEFADRPGFDPVVQAESGFMSMNGYADRDGVRALSPVMDIGTSLMVCNTVLAALMARGHTGKGQYCEVSLFDSAVAMLGYAPMQYLLGGVEPQRNGNVSPDTSPSGVFHCTDATFYVNSGNDRIFERLVAGVLQRPDVAADPRYNNRVGRTRHRDTLFPILEEAFARQPWAHWRDKFREAGIPSGEVRTVPQALASREAAARGLVTRIAHPQAGWVPNITPPPRLQETPVVDPVVAPALGQHTQEVLREVLGCDDARLETLRQAGAFGAA
ncbi:CoA transferase [Hydrogenophaga sp.]|uniref:CaiB/BaiF CoA transferase family protein n=1 Tax=Hydrogenophaga sp. TaxID=1904254 RepID=UPI00262FD0FD|nr:CoA transferase [Hydrogenophaga sp.]MCW5654354.1 CoA transferase [Hydrogenophaga sp.]